MRLSHPEKLPLRLRDLKRVSTAKPKLLKDPVGLKLLHS